jgi:hypothetical protein
MAINCNNFQSGSLRLKLTGSLPESCHQSSLYSPLGRFDVPKTCPKVVTFHVILTKIVPTIAGLAASIFSKLPMTRLSVPIQQQTHFHKQQPFLSINSNPCITQCSTAILVVHQRYILVYCRANIWTGMSNMAQENMHLYEI